MDSHITTKAIIGTLGATPLLEEMVTSRSPEGKFDAMMALYNLSTYHENLLPIFTARAIPPLIMLLKNCKKYSNVAENTRLLDPL